jgi:hypothetical protein
MYASAQQRRRISLDVVDMYTLGLIATLKILKLRGKKYNTRGLTSEVTKTNDTSADTTSNIDCYVFVNL